MSDEQKTVRVRVAVVVTADGKWNAAGYSGWTEEEVLYEASDFDDALSRVFWLEASLPLPTAPTVEGEVAGEVRA